MSNTIDRAEYFHSNADRLAAEAIYKAYQKLKTIKNPSEEQKALIEEVDFCDSIRDRLDQIAQKGQDDNVAHPGQIVFKPEDF